MQNMKLLKLRLPSIKISRNVLSENKEANSIKLNNHIKIEPKNLVNIRRNTRAINYYNKLLNRDTESKIENSNDNSVSIRSFLTKSISIYNNLSSSSYINKINSIKHQFNSKKFDINKMKYFLKEKKIKYNDDNNMELFMGKLNKIFNSKSDLKRVNYINKVLIRNNENMEYNDDNQNEEKKQSMSCLLDNDNNSKNIKNKFINKTILKKPLFDLKKMNNHYKLRNSNLTPCGVSNIRNIKYFDNMIEEKMKLNNIIMNDTSNLCKSERKLNKYQLFMKKKLKNIRNEITDNKITLMNINQSIKTALEKARNLIEINAKEISEN